MKRRAREIEVFSMSAIDLFAAAMGAFALLAIILLPYYQNEIRENTPENAISDLLRAAEDSQIETVEKKKALEAKVSAKAQNVSDIRSDETRLLAELRAAEAALKEKQAAAIPKAVPVPEPAPVDPRPAPTPEKSTVSFRFLGMKTTKDDVVIALDMNRCLGGHEESVKRATSRIIQSLQDNHALQIVGFQQTDSGPRTRIWPTSGQLQRVTPSSQQRAIDFAGGLTGSFGGSASMLDAFKKMLGGPGDAIFLVSDGLPNPKANNGLSPSRLAGEITRMNGGRKEIHTVVVGNYFDYDGTVEFMESISRANQGQFMALASASSGVCD